MVKVLATITANANKSVAAIQEHVIMPLSIAKIYKKFIKTYPTDFISIDDGFDIEFNRLKMSIIYDEKIIASYQIIGKFIDTSSLNIFELLLEHMQIKAVGIIGEELFEDRDKDFYICASASKLSSKDYKLVKKYAQILKKLRA